MPLLAAVAAPAPAANNLSRCGFLTAGDGDPPVAKDKMYDGTGTFSS